MVEIEDVNTASRGNETPPCIGLTSSVLPEAVMAHSRECSDTGVSTSFVHNGETMQARAAMRKEKSPENWYALRTTYGREKKAYDYILAHGGKAYMPTTEKERVVGGKKKTIVTSLIPNIFFVYGTEEAVKAFVYDNYNLPFLRFYYKHTHIGARIEKTPLIVPDAQIRSLQIICGADTSNALVTTEGIRKFLTGERVRVVEGSFKGVEGIVARFRGQQRVGIVIDGLLTALTAYVPTAFLEHC